MAGQIAEAYVQIIPTTNGIASGISESLGGEGEKGAKLFSGKFLSSAGKFLKVGALAATAGFIAVTKSALEAGGALEQSLGGTEAVFGQFAQSVQASAAEAYANMGLSAADYMATANKMGSLFQGSGIEQEKALQLTSDAMQRAADVASVMGIDTASAMESIAGAAKGNFTMMDNLGVAMNATTIAAYALENGINFDWNTASNAEKAELAMQMFMERTAQYAGNYASEAVGTFQGSMDSMKAAATNLLADMATGRDVTQSLEGLSSSVTAFISNASPMIISFASQAPYVLVDILKAIGPVLWEAGKAMVKSLISVLSDMAGPLLAAAKNLWQKIVTAFDNVKTSIVTNVRTAISNAVSAVRSFVGSALSAAKQLAMNIVNGIRSAISQAAAAARQIGTNIVNGIKSFAGELVSAGKNLILGLANGIKQGISSAIAAAKNAVGQVVSAAKSALGIASPSKVFAEIGEYVTLGLAQGIMEDTKPVTDAIDNVAAMTTAGMDSALSVNAALGVATDAEATGDLRTLIATVNALSRKIDSISVYLDGERLVGGLVNRMDNALGRRAILVERGLA